MENNGVNWGEVIDFFSKKYIILKAMLNGSEITVNGDSINVMLKSKSKFMLEQKNANKTISDYLQNTTGKTYSINFVDPDKIELVENKEEQIIKNLMEENAKRALENANKPKQEKASNEIGAPKSGNTNRENGNGAQVNNNSDFQGNQNNNGGEAPKRAPTARSLASFSVSNSITEVFATCTSCTESITVISSP